MILLLQFCRFLERERNERRTPPTLILTVHWIDVAGILFALTRKGEIWGWPGRGITEQFPTMTDIGVPWCHSMIVGWQRE